MRRGRCSCNEVVYGLHGEPLFTHACHCTDCQRRSGGAFCLSMFLEEGQLRVEQGETARCEMVAESGNRKTMHFCPSCGTMLFGRAAARPGIVFLRPGTLDDTRSVRARAHIWTRSKQPWVVLPGDVPCFETSYEVGEVWPAESMRRVARLTG